jgi:hypothetical protein
VSDSRISDAAKDFMRAYFADGRIRQPGDLDEEILGRSFGVVDIALRGAPAWNATVFCGALAALVDAGEVRAWQNEGGEWFYQRAPKP